MGVPQNLKVLCSRGGLWFMQGPRYVKHGVQATGIQPYRDHAGIILVITQAFTLALLQHRHGLNRKQD